MMIRIGAGVVALILIIVAFVGMSGVSDGGEETAMIPPCSMEGPVWDQELVCYWGMSAEILVIPDEAAAAEVDVDISWSKNGVWIGVVKASESDKCRAKEGYFECDKGSVSMVAGGENSNGELTWKPEPGEYRFLAGGDDSQALTQFKVTWSFDAGLSWGIAIPLLLVAAGLAYVAAVGPRWGVEAEE